MERKPLAYSYQRFSSPEQGKGDSLIRQNAALQSFLERNQLALDDSLRFVDPGVSGFRGKHRADDKTDLGRFLALVQSGRVPRGSYLIVESLDRLSREDVDEALQLLLSLTNSGIRVVQLHPTEIVYQKPVEMMKLVMGIMELARGNSESQMKSIRVGAAWERKRKAARESKKAISARCPKWLRRVGDSYEPIPERVETVRRVFELASEGYGLSRIAQQLAAEKRPPFGRASKWDTATLYVMLTNRCALGEYQPKKGGENDGDPISDYYPAAIDSRLFRAAEAGLAERSQYRGRTAATINLFAGLLYSAFDGDAIVLNSLSGDTREAALANRRYVNAASKTRRGGNVSFPVAVLEEAILSSIKEIKPSDVQTDKGDRSAIEQEVIDVSSELAEYERKLKDLESLAASGEGSPRLNSIAAKALEDRIKTATDRLNELQATPNSTAETLGQFSGVYATLRDSDDVEGTRLRLRSILRRLLSRIDGLFVKDGRREAAAVQLRFKDRDLKRTVIVFYRAALYNRDGKRRQPAFLSHATREDGLLQNVDIVASRPKVERELRHFLDPIVWRREIEPTLPTAADRRRERRRKSAAKREAVKTRRTR